MNSVNRALENINMLKDNLNIKKQTHSKKVPLVRFHSTYLLGFLVSHFPYGLIECIGAPSGTLASRISCMNSFSKAN
jgi:hypothetical protein